MANILVFEAKSASRRLVAALLRNHGNCVRDVGDADEALTLVRRERPDLMIIDIATPDIDGYRFVVRMRCDPSLPQPRVLLRAVASVEVEARALAHAFGAAFVIKPTNPELLLATVSAALGAPAPEERAAVADRKSTRLNSSHTVISYAVFCLKKKKKKIKKNEITINKSHYGK